jgi:hypothetical protein
VVVRWTANGGETGRRAKLEDILSEWEHDITEHGKRESEKRIGVHICDGRL